MKNWIVCGPYDRQTLASMRYILTTCQGVKDFTHDRILGGMRKASRKPVEDLITEWVKDYVRLNVIAQDAPRFALKDAAREVMVNGIAVHPRDRTDYMAFTVEPRPGWSQENKVKKTLAWGDYLEGKSNQESEDRRVVTPENSIEKLFEEGLVSFRWGRVLLRGSYVVKLNMTARKAGIDNSEFLKKTKSVDFALTNFGDYETWKVNFNVER